VNHPTPAIVAQQAVRRLPRWALWLFCAAFVLPGFLGRDLWKGNEFTSFGYMLALAEGHSGWFDIAAWGHVPELDALLPYWIGAWAIQLAPSFVSLSLAVRAPFALLLALTLIATWHAAYYLARTPQAQPVSFAFGGEASPKDYARTMADGSLLALIACLGLALLSHEASPILAQLAFMSFAFYGVSAVSFHPKYSWTALTVGFIGLCLCGAPSFAVILALGSSVVIRHDRRASLGLAVLAVVIAGLASLLHIWQWRLQALLVNWTEWRSILRLLIWFNWPVWPLALWTLWTWRRQWTSMRWSRHVVLPLWFASLALITSLFTPTADSTMLLALPPLATLGAFALPTLRRSVSALIDWFTLIFFSGCAFIIWVVWLAMQTGWPAQPAANVAKLAPGFAPSFTGFAFLCAAAATVFWALLVRWRVGKHRHALWKSVVLPAGGAALCWLLLMTLWLPLLDFARSYKPWVDRVDAIMLQAQPQRPSCLMTYGLNMGQMTAFHFHGGYELEPLDDKTRPQHASCPWLLIDSELRPELPMVIRLNEWTRVQTVHRPSDRNEDVILYQRKSQP
jgi:hypothetical protein